ncbi:MAG TPA: YggS family pyridoxal phosphate-dependent enzyme [Acidobacteriota bacterium]|nr:YggS family pyridoxal phosphate-dependent enzyme [Acidobacteriota bacterium]
MKETILQNLTELHGQIADACEAYDRDMDDITIVAVTKTHPPGIIRTVVACGIHNIGESRLQEAEPKIQEVGPIARFHLVGHLQTNKVKKAVDLFDVIQSVDSPRLAAEINRRAAEADRVIECYVQVNTSGEEQKSGVEPDDALGLLEQILPLPNVNVSGLMTVGPLTDDEARIGAAFARCRKLFEKGRSLAGDQFDVLSMGMTGDFPIAIREGSTMIRIGTGIFGPRPPRD